MHRRCVWGPSFSGDASIQLAEVSVEMLPMAARTVEGLDVICRGMYHMLWCGLEVDLPRCFQGCLISGYLKTATIRRPCLFYLACRGFPGLAVGMRQGVDIFEAATCEFVLGMLLAFAVLYSQDLESRCVVYSPFNRAGMHVTEP